MPNNNPSGRGGKRFQKGQTGNPKGSSARARDMGSLTRLTNQVLADIGSDILHGTEGRLEAIVTDPDATVIKKWTAKLIIHSMIEGDAGVYNTLLNRIVGKVKERIEHSGPDGDAIQLRAKMTVQEMEAKVNAMYQARQEVGDD